MEAEKIDVEEFAWLAAESVAKDRLLASLSAWSEREVLRRAPGRCAGLVRKDGREVFVKHFHGAGILRSWKALFEAPPAAREWRALVAARQRGLSSPRPLALGQRKGILKREGVLIAEALENAASLADCLFGAGRAVGKKRGRIICEAAALVRKAHDLGFYQADLHPGNILVRQNEEKIETFLVDFQRVRLTKSVAYSKRWHNLAVLHGGCAEASATDRMRFFLYYLSYPKPLPFNARSLALVVDRQGLRHRERLWRGRQKRCLRENRDFTPVQVGSFCGFARREIWESSLSSLVSRPDPLLHLPQTRIVKDSKTTTVAVVTEPGTPFYVKRYNYQSAAYAAKDFFRSSRARRTWIAANSLHMRGIPVALPLVYLERRSLGVLLESYVLTEARTGIMVRDIFRRYDKLGYRLQQKKNLIGELAALIRKMHAKGVTHRDLKGTNIIAQETQSGRCQLHIVDFDGIRLGPVSRRRRIRDLARLAEECRRHTCFTRSDRLAFLKSYLGAAAEVEWKKVWASVANRSTKKPVQQG